MSRQKDALQNEPRKEEGRCTVSVVYEDKPTRELAIQLGAELFRKFRGDLEFEWTWWGFKYLGIPEVAAQAERAATTADLIISSLHRAEELPGPVRAWFEQVSIKRKTPQGALVVIQQPGNLSCSRYLYLRLVAERAKMDFLPLSVVPLANMSEDHLREDLAIPTPAPERKQKDYRIRPPGWGINE